MEQEIRLIRRTLGLLSSMVRSGESHSNTSERQLNNALGALDKIQNKQWGEGNSISYK